MSRELFIKAKDNGYGEEVNAIQIYLYHSRERKSVQVVVQEAYLRRDGNVLICTTVMNGAVSSKLMDMPRFSQAKFDAIPLDDASMHALVDKLIDASHGRLELELDEKGNWVVF